jgi:hypothetical protein
MPSSTILAGADAKTAFDPNGLVDDLKKALAERVLNAEMDHHPVSEEPANRRNGYGRKTVATDTGQIALEDPRDRQASFDPQLIAEYQRRFPGVGLSEMKAPVAFTAKGYCRSTRLATQWPEGRREPHGWPAARPDRTRNQTSKNRVCGVLDERPSL